MASVTSGSITGGLGSMTMTNNKFVATGGVIYEYGIRFKKGSVIPRGTGTGTITWTQTVGGMPAGTYTLQAYIRNTGGGSYINGADRTITIYAAAQVTTTAISSITMTGATGGGNVTYGGGRTVTARGVCWNTTGAPTIANPKTVNGTGLGVFTSSITGLVENTTYYVRAYATTADGTFYGNQVSFSTATRPTVTTQAVTGILAYSATGNGTVTVQGTTPVTDRGICWNTSTLPTIANNHTHSGTGLGAFTSPITGTTQGITYYVRAFATNSWGTNYGNEVTFIAGIVTPSLTGGTDTGSFPNIGWSGVTNTPTWTGATHIRWYHKVSTDANYTLIDTVAKSTLTKQYLNLLPNTSYSFYCTYYKTGLESPASNVVTINNVVANPIATYSSILIV